MRKCCKPSFLDSSFRSVAGEPGAAQAQRGGRLRTAGLLRGGRLDGQWVSGESLPGGPLLYVYR
jgi:hypothetical protein